MATRVEGLVVGALSLILLSTLGLAREPTIETLQRQLEQRDQVILELLNRVEALERLVGVDSATQAKPGGGAVELSTRQTEAKELPPEPSTAAAKGRGPERPPGSVVVGEGAAERALERSLVQIGALLLPAEQIEVEPGVSQARNEDRTPSFITVQGSTFSGQVEQNTDTFTVDVATRIGLPWDGQLELGLPYQVREVEMVTNVGFTPLGDTERTGTGFGDFRVGMAQTLMREGRWRPDMIGRLTWDTDCGRKADNNVSLGGGFNKLRGQLVAIRCQDPIAFVGGLSYEHVFESGNVRPGDAMSSSLGGVIALSPETSLSLFLSGGRRWDTEVAGDTIGGSDSTVASFSVGGYTLLAPGVLFDQTLGIGLTDDSDDYSVFLSVPVRFDSPIF